MMDKIIINYGIENKCYLKLVYVINYQQYNVVINDKKFF